MYTLCTWKEKIMDKCINRGIFYLVYSCAMPAPSDLEWCDYVTKQWMIVEVFNPHVCNPCPMGEQELGNIRQSRKIYIIPYHTIQNISHHHSKIKDKELFGILHFGAN